MTLAGAVHAYPDKWSAENAAKSVAGVRAVANDIEVKLEAEALRTDREIAENAAENAVRNLWGVRAVHNHIGIQAAVHAGDIRGKIRRSFERHAARDADKIQIASANDTVTLNGTVTTWREREDAEAAAWAAPGVAHVKNLLLVHV